jgi:hypothetical protein
MVQTKELAQTTLADIIADVPDDELISFAGLIDDDLLCAWLDLQVGALCATRADPARRRELGARLAAAGMTSSQIAGVVGVKGFDRD